ncbi:MAG: prepilin-type N-terminal cleavage/methylation domain-containing protein [Planctomycetes bacterium]|nr:prepilin-type N-terminal cleavage/methylation domain-containing protein [Planctomycetota bacterium]
MHKNSIRAFTLLEVLISLAIMGMVMATVMQTVQQTKLAVDAIHNIMETENVGPRILSQIRQDIENIAVSDVVNYNLLKGEDETIIGAGADKLDLIVNRRSYIPALSDDGDRQLHPYLNEVGYRLKQNPLRSDFLELYRREDPLVDDEPFRDGSYALIYDRIVSLDIRYSKRPDLDMTWEENWDSEMEQALPFAIEVYLEIEIQPRRSVESLNIIEANRARLSFTDVIHIPEEKRWRFRHHFQPDRISDEELDDEANGLADGSTASTDSATSNSTVQAGGQQDASSEVKDR